MKKIILLSIALITAGFLTTPAQNNVTIHRQLEKQNLDRWEPDTVYCFTNITDNEIMIRRNIFEYRYHSQGLVAVSIEQSQSTNSWINSLSITRTYDSNNNLLTRLNQNWRNNSWENYSLYTYAYDSKNDRLTTLIQNLENNSWKNSFLSTYAYDSNNNLLTELQQRWENNSWVNYKQYLRVYDENRNGISVESWIWRDESWQPSHNGVQSMMSLWLYYNNMQSVFEMWSCDKLTASYINVADLTAIPAAPSLNAVSIYPNPTRGELRITNYELRVEDIQVFDISGVKVYNTQQTALDISHLPAGIYFVRIKTEKGVVTKKIVKL